MNKRRNAAQFYAERLLGVTDEQAPPVEHMHALPGEPPRAPRARAEPEGERYYPRRVAWESAAPLDDDWKYAMMQVVPYVDAGIIAPPMQGQDPQYYLQNVAGPALDALQQNEPRMRWAVANGAPPPQQVRELILKTMDPPQDVQRLSAQDEARLAAARVPAPLDYDPVARVAATMPAESADARPVPGLPTRWTWALGDNQAGLRTLVERGNVPRPLPPNSVRTLVGGLRTDGAVPDWTADEYMKRAVARMAFGLRDEPEADEIADRVREADTTQELYDILATYAPMQERNRLLGTNVGEPTRAQTSAPAPRRVAVEPWSDNNPSYDEYWNHPDFPGYGGRSMQIDLNVQKMRDSLPRPPPVTTRRVAAQPYADAAADYSDYWNHGDFPQYDSSAKQMVIDLNRQKLRSPRR